MSFNKLSEGVEFRVLSPAEVPPELVKFLRELTGEVNASVVESLEVPEAEKFMKNFVRFGDGVVYADSNVGVGRWSYAMLHGPFAMLAFENLAKSLLKEGESIVGVDEVQFRRSMDSGLKMFAWNEGEEKDVDDSLCPPQAYGTFGVKGNGGVERKIFFKGYKGEESCLPIDPVLKDLPYADITRTLREYNSFYVETIDGGLKMRSFRTDALEDELLNSYEKRGVVGAYELDTTMDVMLMACSVLKKLNKGDFGLNINMFLCAGFRDLQIVPMGKFSDELIVTFVLKPVSKITSNGTKFRDIEFDFESVKGERVGGGVVTIAYSNLD